MPLAFAVLVALVTKLKARSASIIRWLEKKAAAHAVAHMPPSNQTRFARRINRRVTWLRLKDWWSQPKFDMVREHWPRPTLILLTAVVVLSLILRMFPGESEGFLKQIQKLFSERDDMDWRAATQMLLVLLGLPIGFMLWLFRDIHVNAVLENQRKDVNLKEFQEIQLRAAGAIDEKFPEGARESLQIAATHQLAGFLGGEYGKSFQRPAWELLRARLLASSQAMEYQEIPALITAWHEVDPALRKPLRAEITGALGAITKDSICKAQHDAVRDKRRTIFGGALPLSDTVFDGIELPVHTLLASSALQRCSFIGAKLEDAHLEGANLLDAHLEGINLLYAHLEGANLCRAHLEGAYLGGAHLEGAHLVGAHLEGAILGCAHLQGAIMPVAHLQGAILSGVHLEGAILTVAHLEGADLGGAHLEGTDLRGAHLEGASLVDVQLDDNTLLTDAAFDDATQFAHGWAILSDEEKAKARGPWIGRGMKHTDQIAEKRAAKAAPAA